MNDTLSNKMQALTDTLKTPQMPLSTFLSIARAAEAGASSQYPSVLSEKIALSPDSVESWLLLGGCLASVGRFEDAAEAYKSVFEIDPNSVEALQGLSGVGHLEDINTLLESVVDGNQPIRRRIAANFTLGRHFDQLGKYDDAFRHYETGNKQFQGIVAESNRTFNADVFQQRISNLIECWKPDTFAATGDWGFSSDLPVFIVGMPRSGTTLTEQICASHSQVFGAGERSDISRIGKTLSDRPLEWNPNTVRQHAMAHISRLKRVGGATVRVIDKMPDNVLWIGAIATLFPKAKIIMCRRDLRDVCLSCFFHNFGIGYPWTYDLTSLAIRARETDRLMQHWLDVSPLPILEVGYEDLVADQEAQSRRLIDFLGLEWESGCLDFHQTERQVLTASLWQVRQPLFKSSVGHWRQYQAHLQPLFDNLNS